MAAEAVGAVVEAAEVGVAPKDAVLVVEEDVVVAKLLRDAEGADGAFPAALADVNAAFPVEVGAVFVAPNDPVDWKLPKEEVGGTVVAAGAAGADEAGVAADGVAPVVAVRILKPGVGADCLAGPLVGAVVEVVNPSEGAGAGAVVAEVDAEGVGIPDAADVKENEDGGTLAEAPESAGAAEAVGLAPNAGAVAPPKEKLPAPEVAALVPKLIVAAAAGPAETPALLPNENPDMLDSMSSNKLDGGT